MKNSTTTVLQSGSQFSRGTIQSGFDNMGYENSDELTNDVINRFNDLSEKYNSTAFLNADTSEIIGSVDDLDDTDYTDQLNKSIAYVIQNQ